MKYLDRFTDWVNRFLAVVMAAIILVSLVQGVYSIALSFIRPDFLVFDSIAMHEVFGIVLFILLGVEVLEIIKNYESEHHINVQFVFLVAMIAIARKLIITDYAATDGIHLVGIAVVIAALAGGYYVIRIADRVKTG
jgi:uncharacterized membrane protein (DUF373 family)